MIEGNADKKSSDEIMIYINKEVDRWALKQKWIIVTIGGTILWFFSWSLNSFIKEQRAVPIIVVQNTTLSDFQLACSGSGRGLQQLRINLKTSTIEGVCNNGLVMYYNVKTPNE